MVISRRSLRKGVAVLLAKEESGTIPYGFADMSASTDAIYVIDPEYNVNPEVITRGGASASISPAGNRIGQKTATVTFKTELRCEGSASIPPKITRLMKGCGYEHIGNAALSGTARIMDVKPGLTNVGDDVITWAKSGTPANDLLSIYNIKVHTAGASTVAKMRVTGGVLGQDTCIGQAEGMYGWITKASASSSLEITVAEAVDHSAGTITLSGTPVTGDTVNLVLLGRDISYTVLSGDTKTAAAIATKVAAAIDTDGDPTAVPGSSTAMEFIPNQGGDLFAAGVTDAVITVTPQNSVAKTIPAVVENGKTYTLSFFGISKTCTSAGTTGSALAALFHTEFDAIPQFFSADVSSETLTVTLKSGLGALPIAITTASTTLMLGNSEAVLTPSWAGSLQAGNQWTAIVSPASNGYKPITTGMTSLTLALYFDGISHLLTNAVGTFSFEAKAGNPGTMTFTFTGNYQDPEDREAPAATINLLPPPLFELADFIWGQYPWFVAENFTFDQGNEVAIRQNYNAAEGYVGAIITDRVPVSTFDPEATLIKEQDTWGDFLASKYNTMQIRFGTETGNTIWFCAPAAQLTQANYGDRNNIKTLSMNAAFARIDGDDETYFFFA